MQNAPLTFRVTQPICTAMESGTSAKDHVTSTRNVTMDSTGNVLVLATGLMMSGTIAVHNHCDVQAQPERF